MKRVEIPEDIAPLCPVCTSAMRLKTSKSGNRFFGCTRWPRCNGTLPAVTALAPATEGMVVVTNELLEAGRAATGGWTNRQLFCLGLKWPIRRGWKKRVIGTKITPEQAQAFLTANGGTL